MNWASASPGLAWCDLFGFGWIWLGMVCCGSARQGYTHLSYHQLKLGVVCPG